MREGALGPLVCPVCGYNLTGVCTEEREAGECPECGRTFERQSLIQFHHALQPRPLSLMVGLFVWPILIAFFLGITWCCLALSMYEIGFMGFLIAFSTLLVFLVICCSMTGRALSSRAVAVARVGREPQEYPLFYRHAIWSWLLFSSIHFVQTLMYLIGGVALFDVFF